MFCAACTAAASMRSVSDSVWDRFGEEAELSERSGRTAEGFSKDHCWSWADTLTSAMVHYGQEGVRRRWNREGLARRSNWQRGVVEYTASMEVGVKHGAVAVVAYTPKVRGRCGGVVRQLWYEDTQRVSEAGPWRLGEGMVSSFEAGRATGMGGKPAICRLIRAWHMAYIAGEPQAVPASVDRLEVSRWTGEHAHAGSRSQPRGPGGVGYKWTISKRPTA